MSKQRWNPVGVVLALIVGGVLTLLGSGIILVMMFGEFGEAFEIGSTAKDPVLFAFSGPPSRGDPDPYFDEELVSGVTAIWQSGCHDLYPFVVILDPDTRRELYRQEMRARPVCEDDRLVWTGEDLVELDDGLILGLFKDSWPDDLYVAPFSVASTDDEPVVVEHGFVEHGFPGGWTFERAGGGPVDGVTEFVPATICELDGPSYSVRILDAASREILARARWLEWEYCSGGRLLWDGSESRTLDEGEPWPRDLYETSDPGS